MGLVFRNVIVNIRLPKKQLLSDSSQNRPNTEHIPQNTVGKNAVLGCTQASTIWPALSLNKRLAFGDDLKVKNIFKKSI